MAPVFCFSGPATLAKQEEIGYTLLYPSSEEEFSMPLTVGLKGRAETLVTKENTALAVGSGSLDVFATPMMIALMEKAATAAVDGFWEEGQSTVGTHMDVSHDAATPLGMRVWAEAELTALDGRALTFAVSAFDEAGPIGKGIHTRFVIQKEKFMAKANGKAGK